MKAMRSQTNVTNGMIGKIEITIFWSKNSRPMNTCIVYEFEMMQDNETKKIKTKTLQADW